MPKKKLKYLKQGAQVSAEIVNGDCPKCNSYTVLVSIYQTVFRCMTCGNDLEQKINGKISYMPVMNSNADGLIDLKGYNEKS
tara:strand:+ start:328 stop:573 length:246 start_codon:yes stop_codon:yes gene_type:complete